jgi:hypothetical protein
VGASKVNLSGMNTGKEQMWPKRDQSGKSETSRGLSEEGRNDENMSIGTLSGMYTTSLIPLITKSTTRKQKGMGM